MWRRNALFIGLALFGSAAVAALLLSADKVGPPRNFVPDRYEQPEYRDVLRQIDQQFAAVWSEKQLAQAPRAADLTIARRLSLGLTGTFPSYEELRFLESVPEEQRIEWWVSRLLEDRRYADYVAERLARTYVGTENGPFILYRRRRFTTWLSDCLYQNMPYDQLVRHLISDRGIWTNSPSVNFITVTADQAKGNQPDPIRLAGRTTRAFLGMRIDCLQCHDDQLDKIHLGSAAEQRGGLQSDFHHLAAFYGGIDFSLRGITDGENKYEYQYLDAEQPDKIDAAPPFFSELLPPGGSRREQLATWVTHDQNKPFARAIVNRIWALMFGKPLVEPIDDIPLYGEYPPGLQTLADDFVAHDYDLQRLIRVIAGTRVFQLDSRADFEVTGEHEAQWAVFPLTRLRPEQMSGGIIQAASLTTIDADATFLAQLQRFIQQNDFVRRYGDTGEDEFDGRAGTVAQRLLTMNGELVRERTRDSLVNNAATRIAQLAPTDEQAVETAYLSLLTRRPTEAEVAHFVANLKDKQGSSRNDALEDLYWVLINSTEFTWNH